MRRLSGLWSTSGLIRIPSGDTASHFFEKYSNFSVLLEGLLLDPMILQKPLLGKTSTEYMVCLDGVKLKLVK